MHRVRLGGVRCALDRDRTLVVRFVGGTPRTIAFFHEYPDLPIRTYAVVGAGLTGSLGEQLSDREVDSDCINDVGYFSWSGSD